VITWAQKNSASNLKKRNEAGFYIFFNWDFDIENSHLRTKVFMPTSKM
jgi:hypothetical protein